MKDSTYKHYLLAVLLVILAFNFLDRFVLSMLMEDIKQDLQLSDTQLGFLTGIAFALFYSVMGIPIARWADRGNRVTIIWVTTGLWSVMVALCGFVTSFLQLLLIRIGVAVGEAGAMPPAYSLIADYFNRAERPRAVSIYMLGLSVSVVCGFFLGGWLNELYGWRKTFLILGAPGIALAVLARFTLREPRLTMQQQKTVTPTAEPGLKEVIATLWRNVTFRHLLVAYAVGLFFGIGIGQWLPVFFIRSHGMQTGELGSWFAIIWGLGGGVGTYLSGEIASRYLVNNEALQLRIIAVINALLTVACTLTYLTPDKYTALALMGVTAVFAVMINAPFFALIQTLVPERMRAMAIALIMLIGNLIGMGLGPLAAGMLSDLMSPAFGPESLRYALAALSPGYIWVAAHLWFAARTVKADLAVTHNTNEPPDVSASAVANC